MHYCLSVLIAAAIRQESLHKCTGIHSRVLAQDGEVSFTHWYKNQWQALVASFTARDVLLFPEEDAVDAGDFDWTAAAGSGGAGAGEASVPGEGRYRLIVLESSWTLGWAWPGRSPSTGGSCGSPPSRASSSATSWGSTGGSRRWGTRRCPPLRPLHMRP